MSMDTPRITERHRAYWRWNRLITFGLLAVWFTVSFVAGYFAESLNRYSFMGFPLGFYNFAQGGVIMFLLIVGVYIMAMQRLDRHFGVNERR